MFDLVIYILLICIYNSILFFGKKFGLNVILFNVPLLIFITYTLKKNKKINNKKGLLFMIPILLLSISYLIYDNTFFKLFNLIVIILLFALTYIYTMKKTSRISEIILDIIKILCMPLTCIGRFYRVVKMKLDNIFKLSDSNKSKLKSILIVIPIVIIILLLLTSADMIFNNIFSNMFKFTKNISIGRIIGRTISIIILFTYLGSSINYILFDYSKEKAETVKETKIDNFTIKLLLSILNIVYIVFDFIQIRSLILHQGLTNINYAEYARSGFFQLMFISVINIIIILISKKTKEDTNYNKVMSILMILLTFIIIVSSFLRMYMYEQAYGYTLLRLLVYVSLITETILLIPTLVYIINPKVKILNYYITIIVTIYTLLSLCPVDYFIAKNNIDRYYKTKKIDVDYLINFSTDNIPLLCDVYDDLVFEKDYKKDNFNRYLKYMYKNNKSDSIFEYNISRNKSTKVLKEFLENNKWK